MIPEGCWYLICGQNEECESFVQSPTWIPLVAITEHDSSDKNQVFIPAQCHGLRRTNSLIAGKARIKYLEGELFTI